jgi:hypothetical protein
MKAHGEWRYRSTIPDLGSGSWMVSFTDRPITPWEKAHGTNWLGGWVDPRVGKNAVQKRKKIFPLGGSNPDRPACTLVVFKHFF